MSENAINFIIEEVCLTKKYFLMLQEQEWEWRHDSESDFVRQIHYDFNGHNYYIQQFGTTTLAPRKTWFYRNEQLHRLDGPAFYFEGKTDCQRFHCAGHEYQENEFNFFVLGMIS